MRGFLIQVWSITLLVEHLIVVHLFLKGAWSDTLIFFLSLTSQPLSLMDHFRFRHVYCASASFGTPGALDCHMLGVSWSLLHQIHQLCIF